MNVVALDPGKTAGLAWWKTGMWSPVLQEAPLFDALHRIHRAANDRKLTHLVVEDFIITIETAKKQQDHSALDGLGTMRYLATLYELPLVTYRASEAKTFAPNVLLRNVGWYVPGQGHARDASRHLILFLVQSGVIPASRVLEARDRPTEPDRGAPGGRPDLRVVRGAYDVDG